MFFLSIRNCSGQPSHLPFSVSGINAWWQWLWSGFHCQQILISVWILSRWVSTSLFISLHSCLNRCKKQNAKANIMKWPIKVSLKKLKIWVPRPHLTFIKQPVHTETSPTLHVFFFNNLLHLMVLYITTQKEKSVTTSVSLQL